MLLQFIPPKYSKTTRFIIHYWAKPMGKNIEHGSILKSKTTAILWKSAGNNYRFQFFQSTLKDYLGTERNSGTEQKFPGPWLWFCYTKVCSVHTQEKHKNVGWRHYPSAKKMKVTACKSALKSFNAIVKAERHTLPESLPRGPGPATYILDADV